MVGIFKGSTPINDLKLGSTQISEVYVGATKVWPAVAPGFAYYNVFGNHYWVAPAGVTSVDVCCIGANSPASSSGSLKGQGGAGLGWKNNIPVTPGQSYLAKVGQNGGGSFALTDSYFISPSTCQGGGVRPVYEYGRGYVGDGGGNGGNGDSGPSAGVGGSGGGAGGYTGNGGSATGGNGSGGGGGAGYTSQYGGGYGGGVGPWGQGPDGVGGTTYAPATAGSYGDGQIFGGGARGGAGEAPVGIVALRWAQPQGYPAYLPPP